jgi:type VI secretion system protein ImpE
MSPLKAAETLKGGDAVLALAQLQEEVRAKPAAPELRIFLFQLLVVLGQWERALNQLSVLAQIDASALAMVQMYGDAVRCEALRAKVFAGVKSPVVFGQPEDWLALLIESMLRAGAGQPAEAAKLRAQAFELAPGSSGVLDGRAFEWIADADSRLGPVLEAVINGRYYWIPFSRFQRIDIDPPEDLRDVVWMPAHLQFTNGGETVALIPTRYPGSESCDDRQVVLARKTVWEEGEPGVFCGSGQRVLATDFGEAGLMDTREIRFDVQAPAA